MFSRLLDIFRCRNRGSPSSPSTTLQGQSRNIIILGSLGVGKSSLVNMLVGKAVAPVGDNVGVVHAPIMEHLISFSEISEEHFHPSTSDFTLRFFDTLGLDHRSSPWGTIERRLKRSGGVDLVVYCMRPGRLSEEQLKHLRTIWKVLCRGEVPLVLAVCGIDYHNGPIEKWWQSNGGGLTNAAQVSFADHVCLSTWDADDPSWRLQGRGYRESQSLVRNLVIRHCRSPCQVRT